jgi:hypothetical protein
VAWSLRHREYDAQDLTTLLGVPHFLNVAFLFIFKSVHSRITHGRLRPVSDLRSVRQLYAPGIDEAKGAA